MESPAAKAPPPVPSPAPGFDVERIKELVSKRFKVYEVEAEIRGLPSGQLAAFYVQMDPKTFSAEFDKLRDDVRAEDKDLVVILQHRLGEDVILVARRPPIVEKGPGLNIFLLIATIITTTLGGAIFNQSYENVQDLWSPGGVDLTWLLPRYLGLGFLTFSLPLILILGIHELGHYAVAKRHKVRTSLPYFIPVPPVVPLGTFGAFISMREPIPDRKALFDIGASGPILGFLVAIPVVVLGLILTSVVAAPLPPQPEVHAALAGPEGVYFGHNASSTAPYASAGNWTSADRRDGAQNHHEETIHVNLTSLPEAERVGAWRFFVYTLNLTDAPTVDLALRVEGPAGTTLGPDFTYVDGGYEASLDRRTDASIADAFSFTVPANATGIEASFDWSVPASGLQKLGESALFWAIEWAVDKVVPAREDVLIHPTGIAGWVGLLVTGFNLLPAGQLDGGHVARAVLGEKMKWASYASVLIMFLLGLRFNGWFIMALLIVFLGVHHPPPLNDRTPLDGRRKFMAFVVLVILVVTFVPFPFTPI